jgi:cell division protein ZapA
MTQNTAVELWLLDNVYKLGCPADHVDHLKNAGQLLEQRFKEFRSANPRMDNQKVAVMIALQLMQEVLEANSSLQNYQHCEHQLSEINQLLAHQLQQFKPDQ